MDDRLRVALRAPHDRLDARDQLVLVERLGHVVVGAEAERLDLGLDPAEAERIRTGVFTLATRRLAAPRSRTCPEGSDRGGSCRSRRAAEIDAFLAKIGGVDVKALRFEHQLDA